MRHSVSAYVAHLCPAHTGRGNPTPSGKAQLAFPAEVPDFIRRAIALGFEEAGVWALYRRITQTRQDVRTRRITPAGGCRRIDRLALAVAIVNAAEVAR